MTERTGEAGPARISYRLAGGGPNLLLVSGLNGRAQFWTAAAGKLAQRFRVLSFDQRGCGATPDDGAAWSIHDLARDAFAVADAVFGTAPFAVAGHSTGGAIAQCMAAEQPDRILAMVLSGTWLRADGYMRALFGLRRALLTRAPDLDPTLGNLLRMPPEDFHEPEPHAALPPDVAARRMTALLAHDGAALAPRITMPALVIGAEDDRIVPPHLVRELHGALPSATLEMLPDGGHFFPQTRVDAFAGHVAGWLARKV